MIGVIKKCINPNALGLAGLKRSRGRPGEDILKAVSQHALQTQSVSALMQSERVLKCADGVCECVCIILSLLFMALLKDCLKYDKKKKQPKPLNYIFHPLLI